MLMPLEKWQERLERHFESLANTHASSGFPIFALEHGLVDEELEEVSSLLRARLKEGLWLSPHWLLWVVYATERGYGYNGDEYWPPFEEQTPGWAFSDRYNIVPWFTKFQKTYDGVIPTGPWAMQFRIIAWPITHAILPRYLQRQFARALYELRFRLAGLETLEPAAIGRLLAANAYHASTRFEKFLQQEELTGRIVLALLGETPAKGEEPIYPPTLRRIVGDLERIRNAREWLKETQHTVTDRFKGIGRGSGQTGQHSHTDDHDRVSDGTYHLDIQPSLLLRYAGAATWSVVMELPDFRNVAALNADVRTFLRHTRCRLNGAIDTKPAGWLLSGNRKGVLKSWPNSQKPLIEFEQPHGTVDHLLESACRLRPGPVWLFRIGHDGSAREIVGRIVRPGCGYIVITTAELPDSHTIMSPCNVDCSGIKSFRILVSSDVSVEDIEWLCKLNLQVARTIRVWPAGLPGRGWDGEGKSEWLTTETPCFGIVHDHPLDAYALSLNNGAETVIEAGPVGHPAFVRLSRLPSGTHSLVVKARRSASLGTVVPMSPAEGIVELKVREPEPWIPGTSSHAGLIVTLDPHDAKLDTFWEGNVRLSVLGPESYHITCTVSLESADGEVIFSEKIDGPMKLPVTPDKWSKRFSQFVEREDCAWRYLEASVGCLAIRGEELGEYVARFEHDVLPVRWVLRNHHGKIVLRLIDDTGQRDTQPTIRFFGMENPTNEKTFEPVKLLSGIAVEPPGGLFIAKHGEHQDTVVASAGLASAGLQGLGVKPNFSEFENRSETLAHTFEVLESWLNARLAGFLADIRRNQVRDGFLRHFYDKLCGSNWGKAETAFLANPSSQHATDGLERLVYKHIGFAAVLGRDYQRMCNDPASRSQWYAELAARFRISSDRKLCDFALRLAGQPHQLSRIFGTELNSLLNQISNNPALLRGARLLALLCANQNRGEPVMLVPRWK